MAYETVPEPKTALHTYRWTIVQGLLLAGVLGYLYASVIPALVADWENDPDYSHGFLIPLLSGYFLWEKRQMLMQLPMRPTFLGLLVMGGGILLLLLGHVGAELFLTRISLVIVIAGLVLYHGDGRISGRPLFLSACCASWCPGRPSC